MIDLLEESRTPHRLFDHEPEGATDSVSALRGHPASHAAKAIILRVKIDRRTTRHVLAVIPGDRRVDFDAVRELYGARYVGFSDAETAERLARAVPGAVLPFTFDPDLELVADPEVVGRPQLYFNAARLDRSAAISGADYARLARPRVERIASPVSAEAEPADAESAEAEPADAQSANAEPADA